MKFQDKRENKDHKHRIRKPPVPNRPMTDKGAGHFKAVRKTEPDTAERAATKLPVKAKIKEPVTIR